MSDTLQETLRGNMRELLSLLASPEAQRKYEASVPIADVPAELVCLWFDDQYAPASRAFRESFTDSELQLLAEFHSVYEARVKSLPTAGGLAALQQSSEWNEIVDRAAQALGRLGWAP